MIHFKEHVDGNMHYVFIMEIETGRSLSIDSTMDNFTNLRDAIVEVAQNDGSLDKIAQMIEDNKPENELSRIREELGITINPDRTVSLPHGVVLPQGIANVFNEIVDIEHGKRLIKFAKDLSENPRKHSREAMVAWIMTNPSLTILPDGRIRGFRGLREDYTSIHSGYGVVNGKEFENAHLDNSPGNIIEFPAQLIDHNTNRYCSIGLHVGTWGYASGFGQGKYVSVAFSAKDVVSPPSDAKQEKIRVCRMEILESLDKWKLDAKYSQY